MLNGADLILCPIAAPDIPGRGNTWHAEMITRAVENVLFVMGVSRSGAEDGRVFVGQSVIVNPFGQIVSALGKEDEGYVIADVTREGVIQARARLGQLRDMRLDMYREIYAHGIRGAR